jgi:hypothetical protein
VAKVSEDGEVETIMPGEVTITAKNGDCGALMYLNVVPFEDKPFNEPPEPAGP